MKRRDGNYTTLLMSTGLTFGTISALFGLTHNIVDQNQYTILVTVVIGSAIVPTLIAQKWFQPSLPTSQTSSVGSITEQNDTIPIGMAEREIKDIMDDSSTNKQEGE